MSAERQTLEDAAKEVLDNYELRFGSAVGGLFGPIDESINGLREALAMQSARSTPKHGEALSDERIDHIADITARGMPDGILGFCRSWGYRQFARALLEDCAGYYAAPKEPNP